MLLLLLLLVGMAVVKLVLPGDVWPAPALQVLVAELVGVGTLPEPLAVTVV